MVLYTTVHAYKIREKGSMVAVIPKEFLEQLSISKGTKLKVERIRIGLFMNLNINR
jgi:hypothetical protein